MIAPISQIKVQSLTGMLGEMQMVKSTESTDMDSPQAQSGLRVTASNLSLATSASTMASNALKTGEEQSKYLSARERGSLAVANQVNRQNAILASAMAEINALSPEDQDNYAKRTYLGRKAARRVMEEQQTSAQEASEKNLDEIKEEIEKKAEEAFNKTGQTAQNESVNPEEKTQSTESAPEGEEENTENESKGDISTGVDFEPENSSTAGIDLSTTSQGPAASSPQTEPEVSNPKPPSSHPAIDVYI